jgi:1,4-dihydroxy-2-naphthoate octaprenyltransferase
VAVTYFVQAGHITAEAVLAGVSLGALSTNILLVNNYRDMETDAAAGKATLVVKLGRGFARAQFSASIGIALAIPFLFLAAGHGPWCLLPLLATPLARSQIRRLEAGRTPADYVALLGDTGRFVAVYAALTAAGFLI